VLLSAFCLAPLLLLFAPHPAAAQDMCDAMDQLAAHWTELADVLDEHGVFDDAGQANFESVWQETVELIEFLGGTGDPSMAEHAAALGEPLTLMSDSASGVDVAVPAIDSLVERLDMMVEECDAASAAEVAPTNAIRVTFSPAATAESAATADVLRQVTVFQELGDLVSGVLMLPRDLPVVFASCGTPNAFYDPAQQSVVMCYEIFELVAGLQLTEESTPEEIIDNMVGAGMFFLLHEIGHALVDQLQLPITGREEDSVDSLAAVVLLQTNDEAAVFAAMQHFASWSDLTEVGATEGLAFWDEHSLSGQRLYDLACLIFGSDPETYAGLVGPDLLPEERAVRCPAEWAQKDRSWDILLQPHYASP
jgi:hypothetical protein